MFQICKPSFCSALHGLFFHSRPVSSSQERDIDWLRNMDVRGCTRLIKWNPFLIDPFLLRSQFFFVFISGVSPALGDVRAGYFGGWLRVRLRLLLWGNYRTACIPPRLRAALPPPACECWSERGAATINKKLSATHLLLRLEKSIRRKDCLYLSPTHLSQNASMWSAQIPKQNFTINLSAFIGLIFAWLEWWCICAQILKLWIFWHLNEWVFGSLGSNF